MAYNYQWLKVDICNRVANVTIDYPPINLITLELYGELAELAHELESDDSFTVVVLRSTNTDFFLAHFDVEAILGFDIDGDPERPDKLNNWHTMCERFRTMNKITIAQIEGRVGGGGNELAASCDMRFGVIGKTIVNQMEVPLGIIPGGTGCQHLPRLVGRGRAFEIILGGIDLDAETAERWGYMNRVFNADDIGPSVQELASRIASFPVDAVRLAKQAINMSDGPLIEGLLEEDYLFEKLLRTEGAARNMRRFLEIGGQTHDAEHRMGELNAKLGES